jgi:hypothetical protein
MSTSASCLPAAALAGAALGGIYLSLLWLAVRCLLRQRTGIVVFVLLAFVRAALCLGTVWACAVLEVPMAQIIAALFGFIVVRLAVTSLPGLQGPGGMAWP